MIPVKDQSEAPGLTESPDLKLLRASLGWTGIFDRKRNGAIIRVHAVVCSKTA
jgi:hypothetical protein